MSIFSVCIQREPHHPTGRIDGAMPHGPPALFSELPEFELVCYFDRHPT